MKGMKGKLLRKLKTIQAISSLRQGLVFQVSPSSEKLSKTTSTCGDKDHSSTDQKDIGLLSKHFKELNNEGLDSEVCVVGGNDKEAISPSMKLIKDSTLFVKETTTMEHQEITDEINHDDHDHGDHESTNSSLLDFEEKCPPGGSDKVILYTTSLRGIRKTFEDCSAIRFLLESYKVLFFERDVSLHREFREELWEILEERVLPPRLFIKGRYIGGADEVVGVLNEQGKLRKLLEGIPLILSNSPCTGCANVRFSVCGNCSGSRKVVQDSESDNLCYVRCPECNENGLVKCAICC